MTALFKTLHSIYCLQYVGGDANTVPFDQAPAVVLARNLIQKRIVQALEASAEFNEVLRLGVLLM
jgi:hypothetical protein